METILKSNWIILEINNIDTLIMRIYIKVFSISEWNVNPHKFKFFLLAQTQDMAIAQLHNLISLELMGGREGRWLRKLHYQLLYYLSFSYLLVNLLLCFYFILHLSFITDSSLPTVLIDFNQRNSLGIICYTSWMFYHWRNKVNK